LRVHPDLEKWKGEGMDGARLTPFLRDRSIGYKRGFTGANRGTY